MKFTSFFLAAIVGFAVANPVLDVGFNPESRELELDAREPAPAPAPVPAPEPQGGGGGSSTTTSSSPGSTSNAEPAGRPGGRCPSRRQAVPFFRKFSPRFIRSSSRIGYFFRSRQPRTVAFFELYNRRSNDWLYTTSQSERNSAVRSGYQSRGTAGWVFTDDSCGGSALYRLYNPRSGQHFYTTDRDDRNRAIRNGWNNEGIASYIFRR